MALTPKSSAIHTHKLTYSDYVNLPEDGKRYEILEGELAVSATPVLRHQRVSRNLEFILHVYLRANDLGEVFNAPVTVILDEFTVVEPDLVFVSRERVGILTDEAIEGSPDLLVEILSPSTARRDRETKAKLYARFGVDHYWIVDPDAHMVEVLERRGLRYRTAAVHEGEATFGSPLFPGLTIALGEVWA